ncbi:MAG: HD domain-containing protein, partial [Chloroflexi bacterium]|nr:HD domain-containing protein [Chloroflexota bacterium]
MSGLSFRLKAFLILFYAAGTAFLIFGLVASGPPGWAAFLVFVTLASVAAAFPVILPNSATTSVSFAVVFAAMLVLGPIYAALVGFVSAFNWFDLVVDRPPLYKIFFNAVNYAMSIGTAGYAYLSLGGQLAAMKAMEFPRLIIPLTLSAGISYAINTFPLAVAIGIEQQLPIGNIWRQNFMWEIPNYWMLSIVGTALAQVYYVTGPVGITLIVVPLVVARQTFQVYMKLKDAYLETVRSLVGALEAKDPYTRGHSERVAKYAELTAKELKLPDDKIETLRYAALLHDIGKIGIA